MERKYLWLCSSCFCPLNKWSFLLNEIKAFLAALPPDEIILYSIRFSSFNGESILLSILTTNDKIDSLAHKLDNDLTGFFDKINDETHVEVTGTALPFPTFTVQFGLYTTEYDERSISQYEADKEFSDIILQALCGDEVTDETIIAFTIYLQAALAKTLKLFTTGIEELFSIISGTNYANVELNSKQTDDEEEMGELISDVMNTAIFNGDLQWLNSWVDLCKRSLSLNYEDADADRTDTLRSRYEKIIILICEHLNILPQTCLLFNHLIVKSLWAHY